MKPGLEDDFAIHSFIHKHSILLSFSILNVLSHLHTFTPSPPFHIHHSTAMFTGIVEILGKVTNIAPLDDSESGGQGFSITIGNAAEILGDCHLGDSIAINGKHMVLICASNSIIDDMREID